MSEPSDDVATRGRAIFKRLREVRPEPASDASVAPPEGETSAATPADPLPPSPDGAPALTDDELEAFAAPPAVQHPGAPPVPTPGTLPGAEDLPPLDTVVEPASPIHAPSDDVVVAVESVADAHTGIMAGDVPALDLGSEQEAGGESFARPLPRVMAVANQKGGVGKTTTAVNLGACLADIGYRVLVVDLDPQGNASTGLGINIRDLQGSMYDVILHDLPIEDCVEATSVKNLFCAPSSLDLAGAEIELVPAFSRELRLKRALSEVHDDYDFVLIDCPPSLGLLTVNGLAAATEVVVPIQCEYYALEGLGQLLRNVNLVQKNLNPMLEVSAIVLVMYDARTKLADQVVNEVREHFGSKVCKNVVPRTVRLSEAPSFGQPIIAFDPSSRGAIAYRELAKEVSGGTPQRAR